MATPESVPQDRSVPYFLEGQAAPVLRAKSAASVSLKSLLCFYLKMFHSLSNVFPTDVVNSCGGTVTLNNTYWQSPSTPVNAPSTCVMTVRLDNKLVEQSSPICQIRYEIAFLKHKMRL